MGRHRLPKLKDITCKRCNRVFKDTRKSKRRYCDDCSWYLVMDNVRQLRSGQGSNVKKWKSRIIAGVESK